MYGVLRLHYAGPAHLHSGTSKRAKRAKPSKATAPAQPGEPAPSKAQASPCAAPPYDNQLPILGLQLRSAIPAGRNVNLNTSNQSDHLLACSTPCRRMLFEDLSSRDQS